MKYPDRWEPRNLKLDQKKCSFTNTCYISFINNLIDDDETNFFIFVEEKSAMMINANVIHYWNIFNLIIKINLKK